MMFAGGINGSFVSDMYAGRCRGILFDRTVQENIIALKPDVAIVTGLMPCPIAFLKKHSIPFLDFCHYMMCNYPHRIPKPSSYVHDVDGVWSGKDLSFFGRVVNFISDAVLAPMLVSKVFYVDVEKIVRQYQIENKLPLEGIYDLRSNASFVLVHGDINFVPIRPMLPKTVYIGGVQCHKSNPVKGDLKTFIDTSGSSGVILFSLGGFLNTDALPRGFIEKFFNVFETIPHLVIWRLDSIPKHLQLRVPHNVKIVKWFPQQDLLGHPKTKLFISHGGVQGAIEGICHGVPVFGLPLIADQITNIKILENKGMAILYRNFHDVNETLVKDNLRQLLYDPHFSQAARKEQEIFHDQPQSPAQRFVFTVGYTIRHKGAHHLTSHTALRLHWFQYYQCDVVLFIMIVVSTLLSVVYLLAKGIIGCCLSLCKRGEKEKCQ